MGTDKCVLDWTKEKETEFKTKNQTDRHLHIYKIIQEIQVNQNLMLQTTASQQHELTKKDPDQSVYVKDCTNNYVPGL